MTPKEFTNWLKGYLDAIGDRELTSGEVEQINVHLGSVFYKVTDKVVTNGRYYGPHDISQFTNQPVSC